MSGSMPPPPEPVPAHGNGGQTTGTSDTSAPPTPSLALSPLPATANSTFFPTSQNAASTPAGSLPPLPSDPPAGSPTPLSPANPSSRSPSSCTSETVTGSVSGRKGSRRGRGRGRSPGRSSRAGRGSPGGRGGRRPRGEIDLPANSSSDARPLHQSPTSSEYANIASTRVSSRHFQQDDREISFVGNNSASDASLGPRHQQYPSQLPLSSPSTRRRVRPSYRDSMGAASSSGMAAIASQYPLPSAAGFISHSNPSPPPPHVPAPTSKWATPTEDPVVAGFESLVDLLDETRGSLVELVDFSSSTPLDPSISPDMAAAVKHILNGFSSVYDSKRRNEMRAPSSTFAEARTLVAKLKRIKLMGGCFQDDSKLSHLLSSERAALTGHCEILHTGLTKYGRSVGLDPQGKNSNAANLDSVHLKALEYIKSRVGNISYNLIQSKSSSVDLFERLRQDAAATRTKRRQGKQPSVTPNSRKNEKQTMITTFLSSPAHPQHMQSARHAHQQLQDNATLSTSVGTESLARPQHHSTVMSMITTKSASTTLQPSVHHPALPPNPLHNMQAPFQATAVSQHRSRFPSSSQLPVLSHSPLDTQPPSSMQSPFNEDPKKVSNTGNADRISGIFNDIQTATTGDPSHVAVAASLCDMGKGTHLTRIAERSKSELEVTDPAVTSRGKMPKKRRSLAGKKTGSGRRSIDEEAGKGKKRKALDGESGNIGRKRAGAGRKKAPNSKSNIASAVAPLNHAMTTEDTAVADGREEEKSNLFSSVVATTPTGKKLSGKMKRDSRRAIDKPLGKKVRRDRRVSDKKSSGKKAKQSKFHATDGDADEASLPCSNGLQNDDSGGVEVCGEGEEKSESVKAATEAMERKEKKGPEYIIEDQYPLRITNPLLALPPYPHLPRGAAPSSLPVDLIPQGAELWNICDVYFPRPDTYPISYLARFLGFEVPSVKPSPNEEEVCEDPLSASSFDPNTVPLSSMNRSQLPSSSDPWMYVPPLGNFADQVWKRRRKGKWDRPVSDSFSGCKMTCQIAGIGDSDDEALDFVDPMWRTIMSNYRGYDDEYFTLAPATSFGQAPKSSSGEECISFAKERGILGKRISFRFAKLGDEDALSNMNKESRYLKSREDYTTMLRTPNHFFVIAESENGSPLGLIHYSFNWYRLKGPNAARAECNDSSKRVSEMVIFIGDMASSDPPSRHTCDAIADNGESAVSKDKEVEPTAADTSISNIESRNIATDRKHIGAIREGRDKNGINGDSEIPRENSVVQQCGKHEADMEECTRTCKTSLSIVLSSLALEHARKCNIWYGMLEVEPSLVLFYTKYFRMTIVPQPPRTPSTTPSTTNEDLVPLTPLVCDLKKCGYRYAILLKMEEDKNLTPSQGEEIATHDKVEKHRLLIRMPSASEATSCFRSLETNDDSVETDLIVKRKKQKCLLYSNPKEEVQSKIIQLRLDMCSSNVNLTDKAPEVKLSALGGSIDDSRTILEGLPKEPPTIRPTWEVLRSFPLGLRTNACSDGKVCSESSTDTDSQTGTGSLLSELEKKQRDLVDLEARLEPQVRSLLCKAFDERTQFESKDAVEKRRADALALKEYDAVLERRREADLAWQAQLEQDMDAVCDICGDGEVTVDNQILFCEACNVAVHQKCYGIDSVPAGDYFCQACRFFNRDKMTAIPSRHFDGETAPPKLIPSPLPICCELCPRKQGAFVRTAFEQRRRKKKNDNPVSKWVHVVCAKWQGLRYIDPEKKDIIEDVTEMKGLFRINNLKCSLCQGLRGAVNRCRIEGCDKNMHVSCARACGLCVVCHGENHAGLLETENAWTLCCPEHSNIAPEDVPEGSVTIDQLVAAAKAFPPEPLPEPPKPDPKPFPKMSGKERKEFFSDPEYEEEFLQKIKTSLVGASCAICETREYLDDDKSTDKSNHPNALTKCSKCSVIFHLRCLDHNATISDQTEGQSLCDACKFVVENEGNADFELPQCHMCNQKGGLLKRAFAKPGSMKIWKTKPSAFKKSLFGKQIWCHAVCGMWHPLCTFVGDKSGAVDCSGIVMASGHHHVDSKKVCSLCGCSDKVKVHCDHPGCTDPRYPKNGSFRFHLTCARQAGFEVSDGDNPDAIFKSKCFHHAKCECAFRARLEDLIEAERLRAGNDLKSANLSMSYSHASKLLHHAITVVRVLGWAWIWAEWWVERGDTWEPLLEDGQKEEEMTREELGYIDSTKKSRCADARKCRLAALGAALRNREYDREEDGGRAALDRALRAILHVPSLVGRLRRVEIDFFADWLGKAYRSMSPLLGFGDDKIPVSDSGHCVHIEDGSPKYMLGSRPLPGKHELPKGTYFETGIEEPDDFLKFVAPEKQKNTPRKTKKFEPIPKKKDRNTGQRLSDN